MKWRHRPGGGDRHHQAHAGRATAGAATGDAATARVGAAGLDHTFLLMLAPLAIAGVLLLLRTTRTYARDVASALALERRTRDRPWIGAGHRRPAGRRAHRFDASEGVRGEDRASHSESF